MIKMETRIRELESELDAESRRNGDICKNLRAASGLIQLLHYGGNLVNKLVHLVVHVVSGGDAVQGLLDVLVNIVLAGQTVNMVLNFASQVIKVLIIYKETKNLKKRFNIFFYLILGWKHVNIVRYLSLEARQLVHDLGDVVLDAGDHLQQHLEVVLDHVVKLARKILSYFTDTFPSLFQFWHVCIVLAELGDHIPCLLHHAGHVAQQAEHRLAPFLHVLISLRNWGCQGGSNEKNMKK